MPHASVGDVRLYYEEAGRGVPLVLVHEFAGEAGSWAPQIGFFARRYRTIAFSARGYPPSDVPADPAAYSQDRAVADILGLLDALGVDRAHVCGLSMGGYATLLFGLAHPERARSLVVAGCGYGSGGDRAEFRQGSERWSARLLAEGMAAVAEEYARGPYRVQFLDKDPTGWRAFRDRLAAGSALGHALTLRGVQMARPSVFELGPRLERLDAPTLVVTGDEDEPCLEPGLFMKRTIPGAGLVVFPKTGHAVNLEEPEAFNRAVLDFLTAVDGDCWSRHNLVSEINSNKTPP